MKIDVLKFFSEKQIEQIAKSTGFVSRNSPITGFNFILTFTTGLLNSGDPTLNQLVAFLNNTANTEVSRQALDERINEKAVKLLEFCLKKAMLISMNTLETGNELIDFFPCYLYH